MTFSQTFRVLERLEWELTYKLKKLQEKKDEIQRRLNEINKEIARNTFWGRLRTARDVLLGRD